MSRYETCCHQSVGSSIQLTTRGLLDIHRQDNTNHGFWYTSYGALVGMGKSQMLAPSRRFESCQTSALSTELTPTSEYLEILNL